MEDWNMTVGRRRIRRMQTRNGVLRGKMEHIQANEQQAIGHNAGAGEVNASQANSTDKAPSGSAAQQAEDATVLMAR